MLIQITMKRTIITILILLTLTGFTQVMNLGNSRNATLYDNSDIPGLTLTKSSKMYLIYKTDSAEYVYRFLKDDPCRFGRSLYCIEVTFITTEAMFKYLTEPHETYRITRLNDITYQIDSGLMSDVWYVYLTGERSFKLSY